MADIRLLCCPECGATVSRTVSQSGFQVGGTSIGPATTPCPGCGTMVLTGKSEWDDKHLIAKSWFLFTRFLWLLVGAGGVAAAIAYLSVALAVELGIFRRVLRLEYSTALHIFLALLISFLLIRNTLKEIRESRERTRAPEAD